MRIVLSVFVSFLSLGLFARALIVSPLPVSVYLDTEISTNVAFNVGRSDAKTFEVKMELSGSVSNCVQVAFGRDADEDGDLAPDEADFVLGWRGGRYFVEDVAGECRRFAEASKLAEHARFLHMTVMNGKNLAPKTASFISESGVCFADIGAQSYLFSTNWNLAKVTRRGAVPASEWCRIVNAYSGINRNTSGSLQENLVADQSWSRSSD